MKRLHIHVSVKNLEESVRFYSSLFGCPPSLRHDDYARWMLDEPRLNFAIAARGRPIGIDHFGIQADDEDEMRDVYSRLKEGAGPTLEMGEVTCCYSRIEKSWVADPQGYFWEAFVTRENLSTYGEDPAVFDALRQRIANQQDRRAKPIEPGNCCA